MTTAGDLRDFPLPHAGGGVTDIQLGIDGNLWYTDWSNKVVGYLTTSGVASEFATDSNRMPPQCLAVGGDGAIWFGLGANSPAASSIGRLGSSGSITYYPTPLGISNMVYGSDGNLWFTFVQGDRIGRMTLTGALTTFDAPPGTLPGPIIVGPDASLWFGGQGVVGRITTAGTITTYPVPRGHYVRDLVTGPDGAIWFTHANGSTESGIGRLSLTQGPDLRVELSTQAETVQKGVDESAGIIPYKVRATNAGNQDSSGIVVNQFVPIRSRFRVDLSDPGWQCSPDAQGGSFCSFPLGSLSQGGFREVNFSVEYVGGTIVAGSSLYTRSTASDDRAHGSDLYQGDNSASITIPEAGPGGCGSADDYLKCCVVQMIDCIFHSSGCSGTGPVAPHNGTSLMTRVKESIGGALAAVGQTARTLVLYYRVRDEVFAKTPGGQRLTGLYYRHDAELKTLLRTDSNLRSSAFATLNAWAPVLQSIVDGKTGDPISQGQVDEMLLFLNALSAKASPALQASIAAERQSLGLATLAGSLPSAALARADHLSCAPSDTSLCLNGNRFRVEATWTDFAGNSGVGHAVPMTNDTGSFWFFSPSNIELTTKALDGRGVNGHYWFFYGALSNVAYTVAVTDTATGSARTYVNPSGRFGSAGDAAAFPGGSSTASKPARSPLERSPEAYRFSATACTTNSTSLCLNGGRFKVEAAWRDFQGNTGFGHAVPLTADTGTFWFFDSANVELVVKTLDGRGFNNRYWLFYGALSNVEYTVTVTDTVTGAVKTYTNPSGTFASVGDTSAFSP